MIAITVAVLLLNLVTLSCAQETSISGVKTALYDAKIPQDLHFNFNPITLLDVVYPEVAVAQGQVLKLSEVQTPPSYAIGVGAVNTSTPLVVIMVDPDPPSPAHPTLADYRHFVGGDFFASQVPGTNLAKLTNSTPALSEYVIPTPESVARHRYTWLVYRQPPDFEHQTYFARGSSVSNFNLAAFAAVVGLGDPIAGSFALIGSGDRDLHKC